MASATSSVTFWIFALFVLLTVVGLTMVLMSHKKQKKRPHSPSSSSGVSGGGAAMQNGQVMRASSCSQRTMQPQPQPQMSYGAASRRVQPQGCQASPRTSSAMNGMVQSTYTGSGPLGPNTYTFSTAGPKYGATMGGIFDSLQPQHSVTAEFAGTFVPPETRNPRCS